MERKNRSNFKMGTVEMIILFLLNHKDMYGYQLTNLINKLSDGDFPITESTLYPTLYKLLDKGYISDYERPGSKRKIRVYYRIEDVGRSRLADLLEDYAKITTGIERILSVNIDEKEGLDNEDE